MLRMRDWSASFTLIVLLTESIPLHNKDFKVNFYKIESRYQWLLQKRLY